MNNKIIIGFSVALFIIIVFIGLQFKGSNAIKDFESCVEAGNPVLETYPEQCKTPEGETFVKDIGNANEKNELIRAESPRPGDTIESPLTIEGEARGTWYFEASFPVSLLDGNGKEIASHYATAEDDWMTEDFVPFKSTLTFKTPDTSNGTLVLKKDNPSGLSELDDELFIPVKFKTAETPNEPPGSPSAELMTVKAFFGSESLNPATVCEKVFSVDRRIPKTQAVATAAINELLKGPSSTEKDMGFSTSLNSGVTLKKLTIENGVAKADFSNELDQDTAGSCRVTAIRAQITETLMQFSTVKSVVISIDGRVDDILQP